MPTATLWHATRRSAPPSGIRRYECALDGCDTDRWNTESIWRPDGRLRGATPVSWLMDYRQRDADLVHATAATAAVPAVVRDVSPLVVTSHGPIPVRYPALREDAITELQWQAQPAVLARADAIIANSAFTKRELTRVYHVAPSRIQVVPLGVDLRRFHRGVSNRGRVGVLILSSNRPQKRMDIARAVAERLPGVRFLKAGYGEQLNGLDNVRNLGWVSDEELPRVYADADVLFHPSEYESFGLPLVEAMACGTPVVAQDRTAIPEVVGRDGSAGRLVDPDGDVVAGFVDAIRKVLADGVAGSPRDRALRYPWSRTVEATVDVWDGAL